MFLPFTYTNRAFPQCLLRKRAIVHLYTYTLLPILRAEISHCRPMRSLIKFSFASAQFSQITPTFLQVCLSEQSPQVS